MFVAQVRIGLGPAGAPPGALIPITACPPPRKNTAERRFCERPPRKVGQRVSRHEVPTRSRFSVPEPLVEVPPRFRV